MAESGQRPRAGDIVVQPTHPAFSIARWTDDADQPGITRDEISVELEENLAYQVALDEAAKQGLAAWIYDPDHEPKFREIPGSGWRQGMIFVGVAGMNTICKCGWAGLLSRPEPGDLNCPSCGTLLGRQWEQS